MHLDTICTLVDVDKMVVYPNMADSLMAYSVRPSGDVEPDGDLVLEVGKAEPFLVAAAAAMGIDAMHRIDTGLDPVTAEREQWDDGNNTLALAPRIAVAYERNDETNDRLEDAGIEVVRIAGSELGSGRGGPRCMSCPISREPLAADPARRRGVPSMSFGRCLDSPGRFGRTAPGGPNPERLAMADTFFSMFTPEEIALISASGTRVTLPEGWAPISESTGADKAYIILNGTVSVRSHGDEVAQLGPGDIVGETAILNHSLRTATIVALTPLELIHFTKEQLDRLNVEMPSFHEALEKTAAERFPQKS